MLGGSRVKTPAVIKRAQQIFSAKHAQALRRHDIHPATGDRPDGKTGQVHMVPKRYFSAAELKILKNVFEVTTIHKVDYFIGKKVEGRKGEYAEMWYNKYYELIGGAPEEGAHLEAERKVSAKRFAPRPPAFPKKRAVAKKKVEGGK